MNSDSLKKPVDLQGLSLALAKTKADYIAEFEYINNQIKQSDWDQNEIYEIDYVKNKPAIRAGEGENSVLIGQIEQDEDAKEYHLTFDYPTTTTDTVTFTTEDDLSDLPTTDIALNSWLNKAVCYLEYTVINPSNNTSTDYKQAYVIKDIDVKNKKLFLATSLNYNSSRNYSSVKATIYYDYKIANGLYGVAEGQKTIATGENSHAEGTYSVAIGKFSHAEGRGAVASGLGSHAEGYSTKASSSGSHAEGYESIASAMASHAEGNYSSAVDSYSHAEGYTVSYNSHIEGEANALTYTITTNQPLVYDAVTAIKQIFISKMQLVSCTVQNNRVTSITLTKTLDAENAVSTDVMISARSFAFGMGSHAENRATMAIGESSHSEGVQSIAAGVGSHAEGLCTKAQTNYSHAEGKCNIPGNYLHVAGNGTSDSARSNAYTLDWSGNGWFAGKVSAGTAAAPANPTAANDLATKAYVDSATSGITTNLAGLTDTTISSPTNGQVLTYDLTSSKWVNADPTGATYSLSISGSTITLTGTDGTTSSVSLPIYDGSVTEVWQGGVY